MTRVLVLNAHPDTAASTANARILETFQKLMPEAQIRTLAQKLGSNGFDIAAEQQALVESDVIVWQFPVYWYSAPALMKKWIDDVFTHGFAYGSEGTALHGKKLVLSMTTGAPQSEYSHEGSMHFTLEEFLPPFVQTANLCGLLYQTPVVSYGMMYIPGVNTDEQKQLVLQKADEHAHRLFEAVR
ncbi:MAG: NAD(P)H-dependent oxidoreductase [Sutterellaceae bacterium]|nr:NAD(P)H-dependent oxidoreductase [Sutterellaceae bacterium]